MKKSASEKKLKRFDWRKLVEIVLSIVALELCFFLFRLGARSAGVEI